MMTGKARQRNVSQSSGGFITADQEAESQTSQEQIYFQWPMSASQDLQKLHFLQNSAITGDNYAKHGPVGAFQIQIITHDALHCGAHSLSQRCPNHGYSVIILYIIRGEGFCLPIPSAGIPQGMVSHTGISVVLGGCITYYACYHQNIQYEATFSEVFILAI